ncbi:MAG TPA: sodium:solute symporter [Ignavibacteriales bacterium]|nr:sodium:solute symporter [Ignavibacteriales bacterium]
MHFVDYAIVVFYLVSVVVLGFYFQKKASKSIDAYFLGENGLPWWALGASGMASNVDLSGTMILAALIYSLGVVGYYIEIRGGIVLIMSFFMIFMGKWNRRSGCMTVAEWMKFRFGDGKQGRYARIISAVANITFAIGSISYFAIGGGKFFSEFFNLDEQTGTIILISITTLYTVASGLYGVVWTDVYQGFLILIGVVSVVFIALTTVNLPENFTVSVPNNRSYDVVNVNYYEWSSIFPKFELNLPGDYAIFNLLGVVVVIYLFKTFMEGFGGSGGYITQRYFAAKSDRDAGLLSLFWIVLLSLRWPLVTAFAVLGIHYGLNHSFIHDPELVVPVVIKAYLPIFIKGIVVTGFLAAAMLTFTSIINAAAAYWVKDIYQLVINPEASDKKLVWHSKVASVVIVILGILFASTLKSINDIWGWLSLGLGTGLVLPLVLRWFWWRFNGNGFLQGTLWGMVTAIVIKLFFNGLPEYLNFIIPLTFSFIGCILGTFLTKPTDEDVLMNFYMRTRPFGFWGKVKNKLDLPTIKAINQENRLDIISLFIALPWHFSLFMIGIEIVMKRWDYVAILLFILSLLSLLLYKLWFTRLSYKERA